MAGGWASHSYGTQNIPQDINRMGQVMFQKKQQDRQDAKDLVLLKERQKTVAFDRLPQLYDMKEKYPAQTKMFDEMIGKNMKALGYNYDPGKYADKAEAIQDLQDTTMTVLGDKIQAALKDPTDQNIYLAQQMYNRAKKAGIKDKELELFKSQFTEMRKRQSEARAQTAKKPEYRTLGGDIYKLEGGKSTIVQKGSTEQRAVTNAMHDPNWQFADEIEQEKLIQKHSRFLSGKAKPPPNPQEGAYKTADDVKAAFSAGTIKKEEALKILKEQFGME